MYWSNHGRDEHIRHVTIDDLDESLVSVVAENVEGERLYACRIHHMPFHVLPLELGVGRGFRLFSHRPNRRGAIDGLLGAGYISQPEDSFISPDVVCSNGGATCAYCFWAHLNILASSW